MSPREIEPNPFAAPAAALEVGATHGRRIGWKIYLWAMVALLGLLYLSLGISWMQPLDFLDGAITSISFVGLFGFAHRRRIAHGSFWTVWLPALVIWDLTVTCIFTPAGLTYQFPDSEPSAGVSLEDLAGLLLIVPLYVALYRYGHRSPELWATA